MGFVTIVNFDKADSQSDRPFVKGSISFHLSSKKGGHISGLRPQGPGVFGPLEPEPKPEPLQKKLGAGAAEHMRLLIRLLEDKNYREIVVHLLLFIR